MAISRSKSLRRFALAAASTSALVVGLLGAGGAAQASITSTDQTAPVQTCSVDSSTQEAVCVPLGQDLNAAVLEQTHKLVVMPGDESATTAAAAVPSGITTTYIQAQFYSYPSYGGSMILQVTNPADCDGTVRQLTNFSLYGADNDTDSFRSYGACHTKIWENSYLTGAQYGYYVNASYVGDAMVNRASSAQFY